MKIDFFNNEFDISQEVLILDKSDGHVSNFGKQWEEYVDVQVDSKNNFDISKEYLEDLLFGNLDILKGKNVLEVGSGAGRFTEHICKYADRCVSVDLSSAIFHNVAASEKNVTRIKADFLKLDPKEKFDVVITNPPFGSKMKISNKEILSQFDFGHKWKKNKLEKFEKGKLKI